MKVTYSLPVLIGLALTGISTAYMLYLFLKKDEDGVDTDVQIIKTSRPFSVEIKIRKENVGAIIGRGGSTIKEIQEKTNTRISFKNDLPGAPYQVCFIQGIQEGVQLAESMIEHIIMNLSVIERCEIFVPQQVCARIVGRNGITIHSISRISNAKISLEGTKDRTRGKFRRLVIKGSSEEIALAKSLIEEKMMEDTNVQERIPERLDRRFLHKKMGPQYLMPVEAFEGEQGEQHSTECLVVTGKDGFLEVFVSALKHPGCFWVQVVGPQSVELDHLVEEMTDFYRQGMNRECHALKEVLVDQVVAAPFSHDDSWYRARVTDVVQNDYDVEESLVAVYYLDYGDFETRQKKDLCSLRVNFLKLRYQAIECSLAKVKPIEGDWSDGAIDLFEDLCCVAQWRGLMSRVVSYNEQGHGEHEGSPVPAVELYVTSGTEDVCVAEELVKQGYATWEENRAVDQQRNVDTQLRQLPRASKGAASSSMKSDTVVGVTEGQAVMESWDSRMEKLEA